MSIIFCMTHKYSKTSSRGFALGLLLSAACAAGSVGAQALKYTPSNPHFGGSPFNGAELLASAQAQRQVSTESTSSTTSALQGFASNLDARISSGLSQYISNQLFSTSGNSSGNSSGSVVFGTLKVDYARVDTTKTVSVTMTDIQTGETRNLSYPIGLFVP